MTGTAAWTSRNGVYQGFVLHVPSEDAIVVHEGRDQVTNPDDPDGDQVEAIAWWDASQLPGNPAIRPELVADLDLVMGAIAAPAVTKSAETAHLASTHDPLGPGGLWHTPDRHVSSMQSLPDYIEGIAHGLMRDQGMSESEAIAMAVAAVKRWAEGRLEWGHGKVTPEVQRASADAVRQWEALRASHDG